MPEARDGSQPSAVGPAPSRRGELRPDDKIEADAALVNGLISIQEYTRLLVSVEPLVDTLADADERVRKRATFSLKERGGRNAVSLLEQALDDASEEVRLFAAEALEKLDAIYNEAINTLISMIRREPSAKLYYLLGKVYFDYAANGMYDRGMRVIYFEKAIREFERCAELSGDSEKLMVYRGACCSEIGRHDEALELFEKVLADHPDNLELIAKVTSIHFALGNHDKVRAYCELILRKDDSAYRDVVSIWT